MRDWAQWWPCHRECPAWPQVCRLGLLRCFDEHLDRKDYQSTPDTVAALVLATAANLSDDGLLLGAKDATAAAPRRRTAGNLRKARRDRLLGLGIKSVQGLLLPLALSLSRASRERLKRIPESDRLIGGLRHKLGERLRLHGRVGHRC